MSYRLGVDVGGTFTDLLLVNEKSGQTWKAKVSSTPADQSIGVLHGIERVCGLAGIQPSDIRDVMHGTTVATNTVLTATGARVGLVTTKGYRQVLQIARSFVPGGLGGWVIYNKSLPMAPLSLTIEADERVGTKGDVVDVLLRPDDILHDDTGVIHAEVIHKAFRGAEFLYTLQLPQGGRVMSLVPSHHNHAVGEKIGIRLEIDHVMAYLR
jgi:hypothetical protein